MSLFWILPLCGICGSIFIAYAAMRKGHRLRKKRAYLLILASAAFFLSVFTGSSSFFDSLNNIWHNRSHNAVILSDIQLLKAPLHGSVSLDVTVRNIGSKSWSSEPMDGSVFLSWHTLNSSGAMLRFDNMRFAFPTPLMPGETAQLTVTISPYEDGLTEGRYFLDFDLVSEGNFWFVDRGSSVHRIELEVTR